MGLQSKICRFHGYEKSLAVRAGNNFGGKWVPSFAQCEGWVGKSYQASHRPHPTTMPRQLAEIPETVKNGESKGKPPT